MSTSRERCDGLPSRSPAPEILDGAGHLLDFLAECKIEFWKMSPHDELAGVEAKGESHIFTLAEPGRAYVCYIPGTGPVTVTLKLTDEEFAVRWYDPKSGRFMRMPTRIHGSSPNALQGPAFTEDIVLYVFKSKP